MLSLLQHIINDNINYERNIKKKNREKIENMVSGATYHLMERGIRRMEIFQDEYDYRVFNEILRDESKKKECT